jgi:dTDP-4-amino-4,6-dideoxygalactose transaminase
MKKIPFNSFVPLNYTNSFDELFANYDNFREKLFSNRCLELLQPDFPESQLFLTHSATGALELIAMLIDIKPGDEIILPSFTFVSTANAFVSRGAVPVFVDISEDDLNIDPILVEAAITPQTKAIIAVHYAGFACNMDQLMEIATRHNLFLIEDAAMGFGCDYNGQSLGSIGHFGVVSFDITKQLTAVQGGLCIINDAQFKERASNIYHIGTNRSAFNAGEAPYYEWVDIGSKFQMNELGAVVLYEQLKGRDVILGNRATIVDYYQFCFDELLDLNGTQIKRINSSGSLHEFFLILSSSNARDKLLAYLKNNNIESLFHYIPLNTSDFGRRVAENENLPNTEHISSALLRLPLHHDMQKEDVKHIVTLIADFYHGTR